MGYEYIAIIATMLLVGSSIIGVTMTVLKTVSKSIDDRFKGIEERFDKMGGRFDRVEKRLDKMEERFDRVEERLEKIEERLDRVEVRLDRMDLRFDEKDGRFARIDERFSEMQLDIDRRFLLAQKEFTSLKASIARLEGLIGGLVERMRWGGPQPDLLQES